MQFRQERLHRSRLQGAIAMIIWGSRGITSVVESGQFNCPQCETPQNFNLKQVRNFFTLYFIPLIPLDIAGRYVECGSCRGTFAEEITSYDPEKERLEMQSQMLRVMIMAALADGGVDDTERAEIKRQFMELAGLPVPEETLNNEIAMASSSGGDLNSYVGSLADSLSDHGKGLVVRLAYFTMSAAGDLRPGHQTQLAKLADTLQIPQDQYMELINHFTDPDDE
ncbi:MAG: hypothetical protein CMJ50_10345 [Planctomycetaceae bacterium]|jgi:hypothetical protein|nr:hypothetical protein [Planctomycetaceae bacterium]